MREEQAFLREIQAAPADRSIRLVYADWLDERGDPRAELIRIEEEMRGLPFFADRYWQMKPRRNELRAGADEQWLQLMCFGEDHEPLCKDIPQGWRERWRLLREFTERWYGLPMPDVGGHAAKIQNVEASLHLQLPPAMREWIAYASDLGDYFADVLRDCYEVVVADHSTVSLMLAGEEDFYWAVKQENLCLDDPPVDWYRLDYRAHRFAHDRRLAPRLTTFVFQHLLTYLSACAPGGDTSKVVSVEDNPSAGVLLRYLGDVFLGPNQPLTSPY